ncbi:MAG: DUF1761 domain-containing protein [Saprospiraceae bacterium]|nr:DUF1761 domain-containing protein [Saprospiraceae bacterium]
MELGINFTAVLVAVVINFVLGFIWYTPLFGKAWGKEMGYDPNLKPEKSDMMKGMLFMLIGNFLFAYVFAHNIAAWTFVPGMAEMSPVTSALNAAIFTWLGFYVPGELGATVWEKKSWKLFGINTGYHLASLLVVALILTHWR